MQNMPQFICLSVAVVIFFFGVNRLLRWWLWRHSTRPMTQFNAEHFKMIGVASMAGGAALFVAAMTLPSS